MAKDKPTATVSEVPEVNAEPVAVTHDETVRFSIAQCVAPDSVQVVVSPDGTIEDAVRTYNIGRPKPFTAKQLIITPA